MDPKIQTPTTISTPDPQIPLPISINNNPTSEKDLPQRWKSLKDGIWATSVAQSAHTRPPTFSRNSSLRSPPKPPNEQDEAVAALLHRPRPEDRPTKTSLKALLSDDGVYSEEEELGQEDAFEDDDNGVIVRTCCLCMVRHKGAPFIPCGHTFCRLCSRELWICRGNCPLCNGFVLEILDVF